jgi:predicted 2-oxoglutarate/Fe(II)-dependent dioxygenase YbiX
MKKKLIDYVKHYKLYLNENICDSTVKQLKNLNSDKWNQHKFYDSKSNELISLSGNQELSTSYSNEILNKEIIMKEIWNIINKYIVHDLKFNWFAGWNGYTEVRFNKYSKNKKMAEHCDHIHDMFDGERKGIPVLSVLGILNDNYKGGEFIMFQDEEIKFKTGDLLIFPSNFLYPHRVEPVTKGVRYSFISWVW